MQEQDPYFVALTYRLREGGETLRLTTIAQARSEIASHNRVNLRQLGLQRESVVRGRTHVSSVRARERAPLPVWA